jgi:hypothetical protein
MFYASAVLPPRKEAAVSTQYEAGWDPEPVYTTRRRVNFFAFEVPDLETLCRPARNGVLLSNLLSCIII